MRKILMMMCLATCCLSASNSLARGGFSSGGSRGGFSSGRSFSSPSRSFSSPSRSYSAPSRTTTTTTRTINRSYGGGMGYHPMMYPGFGMGYGYSNGMLTGLIIGNMMHPQGTTVYQGGGYQGGSALLYPDGRVVDQNGYQVGTYANGQFTPQAGGMVAQPAPSDFVPPEGTPVVVEHSISGWEIAGGIIVGVLVLVLIFAMFV
ncbi:hypothetical protein [Zavarzinella formosa]|uniref:hypothetical protein n=1 Tax=Zavarzinella formosa TaxID=360055 RepID=UPI0012F76CBC|nr:hypothetical protein [Zavarzinella formosa]